MFDPKILPKISFRGNSRFLCFTKILLFSIFSFFPKEIFATFHCEFRKRVNMRIRERERESNDSYAHCGSLFYRWLYRYWNRTKVARFLALSFARRQIADLSPAGHGSIVHRLSCLYSTDRLIRKRYPREIDFYANEFALTIDSRGR